MAWGNYKWVKMKEEMQRTVFNMRAFEKWEMLSDKSSKGLSRRTGEGFEDLLIRMACRDEIEG